MTSYAAISDLESVTAPGLREKLLAGDSMRGLLRDFGFEITTVWTDGPDSYAVIFARPRDLKEPV
jgi:hypothetical protein